MCRRFHVHNEKSFRLFACNHGVSIVVFWFLMIMFKHRINSDAKKEKAFTGIVAYIFAMLITFGVFAYWQLSTFSRFLPHMS